MDDKTLVKNDEKAEKTEKIIKIMRKAFEAGSLHELNTNKGVKIAQWHVQGMTIAYVLSEILEIGFTWLKPEKMRKIFQDKRIPFYKSG